MVNARKINLFFTQKSLDFALQIKESARPFLLPLVIVELMYVSYISVIYDPGSCQTDPC